MSEWQAIETAPKDTRVLVVLKPWPMERTGEVTFAYRADGVWTRDETGEAVVPTHWISIPDPPVDGEASK